MFLREYLAILRRFWMLVLALPLLVGGVSLALALRQPAVYQATARLLVTQGPPSSAAEPLPAVADEATWATTEYILDDLPFVLQSAAFADDVAATLDAEGYGVDPATVRGAFAVEVTHRAVYLVATAASPDMALALARGAITTLQEGGLRYWGRAPSGGLEVAVLDPPVAAAPVGGLRSLLFDVGARAVLALAAAVGIAFLFNALDDRLRDARQAEEWTGTQVIGSIPRE